MMQLVYISAALHEFSDEELVELLAKARVNNSKLGVTGMLLYHEGSFIQALEGEERDIDALFEKIARDPRHTESRILVKREIEERSFGDWSMGFFRADDPKQEHPEGLSRFLEFGFNAEDEERDGRAQRALLAFRDGRWHAQVDH